MCFVTLIDCGWIKWLSSFDWRSNDCGYLHIFLTSVTMTVQSLWSLQYSKSLVLEHHVFPFFPTPPFSQPFSLKMLCEPHSALSHLKLQNAENVKGFESLALWFPLLCICVWRWAVVLAEGCCSPFVGIHITDQRFWLALGYCSLLPGHLYGRVNTAAQRLTTSHPTHTAPLHPPLSIWVTGSVTRHTLCLADVT